MVFEGDSLTAAGYYPAKVLADMGGESALTVRNIAKGGAITPEMIAEGPGQADILYDDRCTHNVAVIWSGTNDVVGDPGHRTAQQIYDDIKTWCIGRKAYGWKTIVLTLHPEADSNYMFARNAFNALLLDDHSFCDAIADTTGETRLVPSDPTYYNVDQTHLVAAGYYLIAPFVEAAINSVIS